MRKFAVILFNFSFFQSAIAQEAEEQQRFVPIAFSYYGELMFHPGVKVSMEFPLWMKSIVKELKNRNKTKQRSILLIPGAEFYAPPKSHTAVFVNAHE